MMAEKAFHFGDYPATPRDSFSLVTERSAHYTIKNDDMGRSCLLYAGGDT